MALRINDLQRRPEKTSKGGNNPPANPGPPMSRRKQLPTTPRRRKGPDFANLSRFHSAPFQRQPVNRSTGLRFHSAPLHRLKSSKTGCPGAVSAQAFAKSLQPAGRTSGPCRNFHYRIAPKIGLASAIQASRWPDASPNKPKCSCQSLILPSSGSSATTCRQCFSKWQAFCRRNSQAPCGVMDSQYHLFSLRFNSSASLTNRQSGTDNPSASESATFTVGFR